MARHEEVGAVIRGVPPELRARLIDEAETRETNVAAIVVEILADRFNVPFQASGRRRQKTKPDRKVTEMQIDLPRRLWDRIADEQRRRGPGVTLTRIALETLCKHFELTYAPPVRRRRKRGQRSAAAA